MQNKLKNKKGFILLFAVAISGIVAAVALGIANVIFKELSFTTSARNANDAFFAADVGAECALLHDKASNPHFRIAGPAVELTCKGVDITPTFSSSGGNGLYEFVLVGLGNTSQACAKVSVQKQSDGDTVITSRGYNVGDSSCDSTNLNRVERRVRLEFGEPPTLGFAVDAGDTLTDNLVAYWKMDEISGPRADSVGANTLTDNNTVTSIAGKQGNGTNFVRANNEYLSSPDNAALSTGNISYTFAGWVYLSTIAEGGYQTILAKYEGNPNPNREYWLGYDPSIDRFSVYLYDATGTRVGYVESNTVPAAGVWYFVLFEYNTATDTVTLSVNNSSPASDQADQNGGAPQGDTTATFRMGGDGAAPNYLNGYLDEWGMWKRILTSQEKSDLYNSGNGNTYGTATGPSGPTITASPSSVAAGGTITVTASNGPGNPRDWIGLFAVGTPNGGGYLVPNSNWKYLANNSTSAPASGVTGGVITLFAPNTPGTYEARFFPNDGYTPLLDSSNSITVP